MKRFTIGVLICALALVFCSPALAMDYSEPFRNAVKVVAQGPDATGMNYGLVKVITQDGKCYLYLTDRGQYVKFKSCDDAEWTELYPKVNTTPEE